jgi:hypothetical protein
MRDTFLCEQDIHNIVGKLTKETHKTHENDIYNVHTWIQEHLNVLFYYHESALEVGGKITDINILFTIRIQSL